MFCSYSSHSIAEKSNNILWSSLAYLTDMCLLILSQSWGFGFKVSTSSSRHNVMDNIDFWDNLYIIEREEVFVEDWIRMVRRRSQPIRLATAVQHFQRESSVEYFHSKAIEYQNNADFSNICTCIYINSDIK